MIDPFIVDIAAAYSPHTVVTHLSPEAYRQICDQTISCIRFLSDPTYDVSADRPTDHTADTADHTTDDTTDDRHDRPADH